MIIILLIGILYIILGSFTLLVPLLFIELSRPKDLIKSGSIIISGIFLLIYKNTFTLSIILIISLNAILISVYFVENFSYRWNQLLDKEKYEIKSFNGFFKNLSLILNIIKDSLKKIFLNKVFKRILSKNSIQKKWVRSIDKNNESIENKTATNEFISNSQATNLSKEDIIYDEKKKTTINKFDNK